MWLKGALTAVSIPFLALLGACDTPISIPDATYPEDAWFALALTDNSWTNHDVAPLVKLDFNSSVRENVVAPKQVDSPPVLDGRDNDQAWNHAEVSTIILEPAGDGTGISAVSVKCVYTEEEIFFFLIWQDPTSTTSDIPGRWKYSGGWWYNRFDENGQPDQEGELIAEDMLAFFWADPDVFPDFDQQGCTVTCHQDGDNGYYHAAPRLTYLDAWIWGAGRTKPREQMSDGYLAFPGFRNDVGTAPYLFNQPPERTLPWTPVYQHVDDPNANVHFLFEEEAVVYQPGDWIGGSTVPGYVLYISDGSRADVAGYGRYEAGYWSVELKRALLTEDVRDFQFRWPEVQGDEDES